jgi:hypothetical protein
MKRLAFAICAFMFARNSTVAQTTLQAREVWRIDGSEAGEPFGDLRDFVSLPDGSLWVLDFKDQNIRRYSATGKLLGVVGRKGSGPGEMANANGLAVAPNGMVWVNDPSNARINIYDANGKFLRQITRSAGGYMYRWQGWFDRSTGELYEMSFGGVARLKKLNSAGDTTGSVDYPGCHDGQPNPGYYRAETKGQRSTNRGYPFTNGGGLAARGDKMFWCAAARGTRVALIRLGTHDTVARTAIDVPLMKVEPAERDNAVAEAERAIAEYTVNNFDKSKIPGSKPGIASLSVDDDGRLWVQHQSRFGAKTTTLDVHDREGKHLGRLTIPARVSSHLPKVARGDRVWMAIVDDDDVPAVVQYRFGK